MFSDWHRSFFVKECQGIRYWCPNANWLVPPYTRPRPGERGLPTPQSYGWTQRPYGEYGIGLSDFRPTLAPPRQPWKELDKPPALEPSDEPQGPPVRFTSKLAPIPENPLWNQGQLIGFDIRLLQL